MLNQVFNNIFPMKLFWLWNNFTKSWMVDANELKITVI